MARYYPSGSGQPGSKGYDPDPLPNDIVENNFFSDWLYGEWSEDKYRVYQGLNLIPIVSKYMDYLFDIRADREYMKHNQVDWSDIHDPRKLSQTRSSNALYGSVLNFVSDNVKLLYK